MASPYGEPTRRVSASPRRQPTDQPLERRLLGVGYLFACRIALENERESLPGIQRRVIRCGLNASSYWMKGD